MKYCNRGISDYCIVGQSRLGMALLNKRLETDLRTGPRNSRVSQGALNGSGKTVKGGTFPFMSKLALNINGLSLEERLRLIEELWDSLSEEPGTVPLTNAQREELDRRLDDLERSGPKGIPWDQVLQQIRSRSR